jgi:adenylylsulfate kinase-like enzyme
MNLPYEAPTNPELTLSHTLDADDLSEKVIQFLVAKGILS